MEYELEVKYQDKILNGVLINDDGKFIILKLASGYNANLNKKECEIISKKKIDLNGKNKKTQTKKETKKHNLPKITILHTGGTIASKVDYKTGAVSSKFSPEELLNLFPELNEIAQIDAKMIRNMASDDIRFAHYNIMLDEIKKAITSGAEGIIITHGTDTLHYTSCALQYALENLPIPVILVGAQRSSDRPSSDAFTNLFAGVKFIIDNSKLEKKYSRVGICMHETVDDNSYLILDGINAKKMHSTRRDAFKQINYEPVSRINLNEEKIKIIRKELFTNKNINKFTTTNFTTNLKIGFIKIHPNMFASEFDNYSKFDALIIEGTGLGHIPISKIDEETNEHLKILKSIKKLISSNVKVIVGVQTTYGEVNRNVYSPGRILDEIGVLGNHTNLTTESLFARTAYLLSKNKKDTDFKELWNTNLEEFKIRSEMQDF